MLHAYVQRLNVTENLEKFCKILETKGVFSSEIFWLLATVALSLLFGN